MRMGELVNKSSITGAKSVIAHTHHSGVFELSGWDQEIFMIGGVGRNAKNQKVTILIGPDGGWVAVDINSKVVYDGR